MAGRRQYEAARLSSCDACNFREYGTLHPSAGRNLSEIFYRRFLICKASFFKIQVFSCILHFSQRINAQIHAGDFFSCVFQPGHEAQIGDIHAVHCFPEIFKKYDNSSFSANAADIHKQLSDMFRFLMLFFPAQQIIVILTAVRKGKADFIALVKAFQHSLHCQTPRRIVIQCKMHLPDLRMIVQILAERRRQIRAVLFHRSAA